MDPQPDSPPAHRRTSDVAAEAVREAFRQRAGHAIDHIARSAPIEATEFRFGFPLRQYSEWLRKVSESAKKHFRISLRL